MEEKIIVGTVVAGDEMKVLKTGTIVTRGAKIESVYEGKPSTGLGNKNIIDARNYIICPSLINAHIHLSDSLFKEAGVGLSIRKAVLPPFSLKDKILNESNYKQMKKSINDSLKEMLKTGTVYFCDFRDQGLLGIKILNNANKNLPIKSIVLGRTKKYPSFSEKNILPYKLNKPLSSEVCNEIEEIINNSDGISIATINDFTNSALEQLHCLKEKYKSKIFAAHAAETISIRKKSIKLTGKSDVYRALKILKPDFLVHLANATKEDINFVAQTRIPIVICPRANAVLGIGIYNIFKLISRGILVGLGTDNVMLNNTNMFREMEFLSKISRGLRKNPNSIQTVDIFKMATINNAKILNCDNNFGSIYKGKKANFIFIDTNTTNLRPVKNVIATLVHRIQTSDISAIMVNGKFYKHFS